MTCSTPSAGSVKRTSTKWVRPKPSRGRKSSKRKQDSADSPKAAKPAAQSAKDFDARALGLPTQPVEVIAYLAGNYKGVGQKMAESLVDAFGGDGVFAALQTQPDRVKEVLGTRRGEKLIEAWQDDYAFRLANNTDPEKQKKAAEEAAARGARGPRGGGRGRRGGRGPYAAQKI